MPAKATTTYLRWVIFLKEASPLNKHNYKGRRNIVNSFDSKDRISYAKTHKQTDSDNSNKDEYSRKVVVVVVVVEVEVMGVLVGGRIFN